MIYAINNPPMQEGRWTLFFRSALNKPPTSNEASREMMFSVQARSSKFFTSLSGVPLQQAPLSTGSPSHQNERIVSKSILTSGYTDILSREEQIEREAMRHQGLSYLMQLEGNRFR